MIKILSLITVSLLALPAYAASTSGHFFYTDKYFDFTKSIIPGKCTGRTPYPVLANEDEDLLDELNDEIFDFVQLYAICNEGDRSNFSVSYDLPASGTDDYFSIRWITKKDGKIHRIDALSFNILNGDLIVVDDIFNHLSGNLIKEMIKLSDGHLPVHASWETFLDKIGKRDIQYYIKNKEWYIVFNSNSLNDKVVDVKIPEYFLQGDVFGMK